MLRNMKIGARIIIGFLIGALLSGVVGFISVKNLKEMEASEKDMYEKVTVAIADLQEISMSYQRMRVNTRDVILANTPEDIAAKKDRIYMWKDRMEKALPKFEKTIVKDDIRQLYNEFLTVNTEYQKYLEQFVGAAVQNKDDEALAIMASEGAYNTSNKQQELLDKMVQLKVTAAENQAKTNEANAAKAINTMVTLVVVAVIIAILVGILIARGIANPVQKLTEASSKLAKGDIDVEIEDNNKDEVGMLSRAFRDMIANIKENSLVAERMAQGDLSMRVVEKSERDILSKNLNLLSDNIKALVDDAKMLAKAGVEGRLSTRAEAAKHSGEFRAIVDGVNETLDAVIKPVEEAASVLNEMSKGNLNVEVRGNYKGDHELIKTSLNTTIETLSSYLGELNYILGEMANGNLNVSTTVDYKGDFIALKNSLNNIVSSFNDILKEMNSAAEEVASGARQVSDSSQALSEGSTEQASAVEELTASMTQIAAQTKQNAVNANQANELAVNAKENAETGNSQMKEMLQSMEEINESSSNISKIIKVIDEIAFQTNILALNAAVEAARAGQHGKGFAVVAEEVRNLAARSSNAAKETTVLIEGSIKKVEDGTKIANETAEALVKIVDGIEQTANLVADIAAASNEQATAIAQVNTGISQVSDVTQNNSATAEESAAASQQLSSQAELLQDMVGKFKLRRGNYQMKRAYEEDDEEEFVQKPKKESGKVRISLSDNEFGKY